MEGVSEGGERGLWKWNKEVMGRGGKESFLFCFHHLTDQSDRI